MKVLKIVKKQVCHIRHEMSQKNKNKSKNVENIKNVKNNYKFFISIVYFHHLLGSGGSPRGFVWCHEELGNPLKCLAGDKQGTDLFSMYFMYFHDCSSSRGCGTRLRLQISPRASTGTTKSSLNLQKNLSRDKTMSQNVPKNQLRSMRLASVAVCCRALVHLSLRRACLEHKSRIDFY